MIDKYNENNVFAQIIKNESPSEKIYEDNDILIIKDAFPDKSWATHLLCITKIKYTGYSDFINHAYSHTILSFFKKIDDIAKKIGLGDYQLMTNNGKSSGQEIMHFHVHIKSQHEIKNECDL